MEGKSLESMHLRETTCTSALKKINNDIILSIWRENTRVIYIRCKLLHTAEQ